MSEGTRAIGCARCRPFGGHGWRLETAVDREHPFPRAVVCECVVPHCICGALKEQGPLKPDEVPTYEELRTLTEEAVDEQECPCWPIRRLVERLNALLDEADIPDIYRGKLLGDYRTQDPNGKPISGAEVALGQASTWLEQVVRGEEVKGLYLYGPPGDGKTLLASILLTELILRTARPGLFVKLTLGYFERLRHTYDEEPGAETASDVIEQLVRTPYLVLDDLGTERGSAWEVEWLYNLIDARYQKRRLLIVTSNHPVEELRELAGGRIASRLRHMCRVLKMPDRDLRELFAYGS